MEDLNVNKYIDDQVIIYGGSFIDYLDEDFCGTSTHNVIVNMVWNNMGDVAIRGVCEHWS